MAISLFLCALERMFEMTTTQIRAFLDTPHEALFDVLAHRPRNGSLSSLIASLRSAIVLDFLEYTRFKICTPWG